VVFIVIICLIDGFITGLEVSAEEEVEAASVSDALLMSFVFFGLFVLGQLNCKCPALP